jgi:hypothetical protein
VTIVAGFLFVEGETAAMNHISEQALMQRTEDAPTAKVGDMLLMMSVEKGQYFSLNEVGSRIWELLERPVSAPVLVEQLVSEYEVAPDDCQRQVADFIGALRNLRLLTDVAPSSD